MNWYKKMFFDFTGTALYRAEEVKHSGLEMFEEVVWIIEHPKQWEFISEEKILTKRYTDYSKYFSWRQITRMTVSHFTSNSLSRTVYNSMSRLSLLRSCSFPSTTHIFSTGLSPYVFLECYAMIQLGVSLWMPAFLHSKLTNLRTSYFCE